ncbi:alkylhydroperoxidase AhpD family core domain-containing protein [Paenibacillus sp. UNCCL117]|uniref:carboxymuconolactone decarboxylase family protein n=1 Tax=unclassified Paenibacillus TaxID=185978 RepID=UPI00088A01FF|nr:MULTISPECIES: carboxymuconolactone decarboxylase family protein [unclassified Paenibacillus]SDD84692.1 alkylhydroperoxidase AhpD family core domain-containing protein [Paenibacillus sp. cl123]SFW54563.1 alkylhydroperoxidase AhpD family core domain-containing protein [Paenibacillus sp. UNCCL117]
MKSRMDSPALIVPDMSQALQALGKALFASAKKTGIPSRTLFLAYLRASQINGDSVCVELHSRNAFAAGDSTERLLAVSAWRETEYFDDTERAALALSEAVTRLNDRVDPVPDDIFNEAARHFDVAALATLIAGIATANLWNRLNVSTRQVVTVSAGK